HVVVELQLEEVAVLAEMARGGVREGERVVVTAHLLGADAGRGVGAEAEAHLAAVVERHGARRAVGRAERHAGQDEASEKPPCTISSGWRRKGPSWRARYTMPWTTVCSSAQRNGKSGSGSSATPSSSRASRRAPSSNDSPAASTPPTATSQWPG